jgi:predicted NUDIX family NTP pyrophosphohydrolase
VRLHGRLLGCGVPFPARPTTWQCGRVPKRSAGLLLYRHGAESIEVLLVHPGGPLWAKRDLGAWSIPKGEVDDGDDRATAAREFAEELGQPPPETGWIELGEVVQSGGKRVLAWAALGDFDVAGLTSNTFEMEWPPRSGRRTAFPEVDRAAWCTPEEAGRRLIAAQAELVERLVAHLG